MPDTFRCLATPYEDVARSSSHHMHGTVLLLSVGGLVGLAMKQGQSFVSVFCANELVNQKSDL